MIKSFYIDNFKSLVDFRLPPAPHGLGQFTCLVGLNGAGKSTVLQAFDFIGHLANGEVSAWLKQREWKRSDLTSRFLKKQLIKFELEVEIPGVGLVTWSGSFNTRLMRCTAETITPAGEEPLLHISEKGELLVAGRDDTSTVRYPLRSMKYQGSMLSFIDVRDVNPILATLKHTASNLRSLDLLSPQSMRQRAKDATDIGYGGERLSAFIHGLPTKEKVHLAKALQRFYPQVADVTTTALRAGWKDLRIIEQYNGSQQAPSRLESDARQVNDGLLRVLAILSQVSEHQPGQDKQEADGLGRACVLFDEIENGINPELVQKLVEVLLHAERQVIVTTHSPLVLNYLSDEVARESVLLLYRNQAGHTKVVRLFDLPSTQKKLALLGPGEVFVDTDLATLPGEARMLALVDPA